MSINLDTMTIRHLDTSSGRIVERESPCTIAAWFQTPTGWPGYPYGVGVGVSAASGAGSRLQCGVCMVSIQGGGKGATFPKRDIQNGPNLTRNGIIRMLHTFL